MQCFVKTFDFIALADLPNLVSCDSLMYKTKKQKHKYVTKFAKSVSSYGTVFELAQSLRD